MHFTLLYKACIRLYQNRDLNTKERFVAPNTLLNELYYIVKNKIPLKYKHFYTFFFHFLCLKPLSKTLRLMSILYNKIQEKIISILLWRHRLWIMFSECWSALKMRIKTCFFLKKKAASVKYYRLFRSMTFPSRHFCSLSISVPYNFRTFTVGSKIIRALAIIGVGNSYLMQFYKINIFQIMTFRLDDESREKSSVLSQLLG